MDKAKTYADQTLARVINASKGLEVGPLTFAEEIEKAFRAGEACGCANANKRETLNEPKLNFERGLA